MHINLTPDPFPKKEGGPENIFNQIPRLSAVAALSLYRMTISPVIHAVLGPACRFEPSCSRFASDAIREHGLMRGGAMALRRLARCHPLGGHGYDPVPAKRP
jgi:putative membrane protein insertion efficiency factor